MKRLSLYLLGLMCCITVKAQFSVAVVGGPQSTSVTPAFTLHPDTVSRQATNKMGLHLGFIANLSLGSKQSLFFRTGVIYSQKGSKVQQRFDTSLVDLSQKKSLLMTSTELSVNYIDAPFNLLYKKPLKGKTKFIIGGGLQVSLFYNGKTKFNTVKVSQVDPTAEVNYDYAETSNNDLPIGKGEARYKVAHWGANALTGFEFGKAFLTVNYSRDLTPFYKANGQSFKYQTLGLSLGIFLGTSAPKPVVTPKTQEPPPVVVVIKDKDGDGIPDEKDECPELAGKALTNGCPDRDGDGVADKDDQCPDIPGLKKYKGCPIPDSDKDGINDEEDQCPNEPGTRENHGCPQITREQAEKIAYAARQIQFEFKKSELDSSTYPQLEEVVTILKKNPTLNLRIEGHTSGANSETNRKLSQLRAESVRNYFVSKGIEANRLKAIGYGSTRPLSPGSKQAENPKDRRVELIVY